MDTVQIGLDLAHPNLNSKIVTALAITSTYHTRFPSLLMWENLHTSRQDLEPCRKLCTVTIFGVSNMRGKGIASVGCSQFLSSYTAKGGESII